MVVLTLLELVTTDCLLFVLSALSQGRTRARARVCVYVCMHLHVY